MGINKIIMIIIGVALLIVAGFVYSGLQSKDQANSLQELAPPEVVNSADSASRIVSLSDYQANAANYQAKKLIYFFRTERCFACRAVAADARANPQLIPSDVVIVEVDFDTNTDLKERYHVAAPTTFIQVDKNGEKLNSWQADNVTDMVAGIKS